MMVTVTDKGITIRGADNPWRLAARLRHTLTHVVAVDKDGAIRIICEDIRTAIHLRGEIGNILASE